MVNFLNFFFSFCFLYPRLGAEAASNPEMLMDTDIKIKTQQEPALSSQKTWEGQPSKMRNFGSSTAKHHQKKAKPHPFQCQQVEWTASTSCRGCDRVCPHLYQGGTGKAKWGARTFIHAGNNSQNSHLLQAIVRSPTPQVSTKANWETSASLTVTTQRQPLLRWNGVRKIQPKQKI